MKLKIFIISVLLVLVVGQISPTPGMATANRSWILSGVFENTWGITALEVFKDQLFAADYTIGGGCAIHRTRDGQTWLPASQPAFGQTIDIPENWYFQDYIYDMIAFQGKLYVGYGGFKGEAVEPYEGWEPFTAQIWRTANGTNWQPAVSDGFGVFGNEAVTSFSIFNGFLYAGVANYIDGFQVWRSADGTNWNIVIRAMDLGFPLYTAPTLTVYHEMLFVTAEDWEGDGYEPVRVWNTLDGVNWQEVGTNVFGDPYLVSAGDFVTYKDTLYLGMGKLIDLSIPIWYAGESKLYKTTNGFDWQPVNLSEIAETGSVKIDGGIVYDGLLYINDVNWGGMGVWESSDGLTWNQVNVPGFGEPSNLASYHSRASATFKGDLYFGTWNFYNRGQVWRWCITCK